MSLNLGQCWWIILGKRLARHVGELEHLVGIDYVSDKGVRLRDASLDDFERVMERALQQATGAKRV